jgi:ribose-phosphate pyrophosphokinase
MAQATTKDLTTLPVGRLGLIPLISCKDLGEKVNEWLIQWRKERTKSLILLHLRVIREIPI